MWSFLCTRLGTGAHSKGRRVWPWSCHPADNGIDCIRHGYIMRRMSKSSPTGPLTPAVFHILLALYGRERHGYDIMQQVKEDSQGAVKMGPGTLYGSLDRMIAAGLVVKSKKQDPRRIYY